jgi:YfiH family protein
MVQSKLLNKFRNIKHFFAETDSNIASLSWQNSNNKLFEAEQIHGNKVSWLGEDGINYVKDVDGLGTEKLGLVLKIRTADCLPIFIFDIKKNLIVAIHAGWKGLYLGIINKAIELLKEHGGKSKDLIIAIGPHIKKCCYAVPQKRIERFFSKIPKQINYYIELKGNWFLDLESIAIFQLMQEGIKKDSVDILSGCTCCGNQFFSYRRDGKNSGRMSNIIYLTDNKYEKN